MSGYVPNNRHIRKPPEPEPYNGNFDQQVRLPLQTPPAAAPLRMVGMRFIWDNGELLPPNIPYQLTADQGSPIRGGLDARGSFTQHLHANHYEAQLLAEVDVDSAVASARSEMQAALDEILAAERAEAEKLRKEQEGRNLVVNYFHVRFAFGKGFFLGAWGLVKSLKEMSDLINPFNTAWNMLASAWKAKATPQEGWYANFLNNYSATQHEELVEALGFDPASITREKVAEAYEVACFIYDDGPSKDILGRFAVDYAKAQNIEEVAEFGGGAVFELVLAALLVIFTGGAGIAARGATSIRHAASLERLGNALQRLSRALKNAKIKLQGRGKGTGTGAQTVEVARPDAIKAEKLGVPSKLYLTYPVETKPNTAFFWSGKTDGIGGETVARQVATTNKGTTLEALIEDRNIQMPAWNATNPDVVQAWKTISADYATGASGTVRAVIGKNLRPGNVWETAELPALMRNPNVDRIITIDPVTKIATEIFVRTKR
jgi:hypothetical protein